MFFRLSSAPSETEDKQKAAFVFVCYSLLRTKSHCILCLFTFFFARVLRVIAPYNAHGQVRARLRHSDFVFTPRPRPWCERLLRRATAIVRPHRLNRRTSGSFFFFPLPASLRRRTCWILIVRACLTWDPARRTCPSGQPRERSSSYNVCDGVARTIPSALRTRLLRREVGDPEAQQGRHTNL